MKQAKWLNFINQDEIKEIENLDPNNPLYKKIKSRCYYRMTRIRLDGEIEKRRKYNKERIEQRESEKQRIRQEKIDKRESEKQRIIQERQEKIEKRELRKEAIIKERNEPKEKIENKIISSQDELWITKRNKDLLESEIEFIEINPAPHGVFSIKLPSWKSFLKKEEKELIKTLDKKDPMFHKLQMRGISRKNYRDPVRRKIQNERDRNCKQKIKAIKKQLLIENLPNVIEYKKKKTISNIEKGRQRSKDRYHRIKDSKEFKEADNIRSAEYRKKNPNYRKEYYKKFGK